MKKSLSLIVLLLLIGACRPLEKADNAGTTTPEPSPELIETTSEPYVYLTPTPGYPEEGFGPYGLPVDINPLTGLSTDPKLLDRRPMIIKVSNLPRNVRPQFGLSRADIVYEYYTEEGTTRFAAIYYSQEAEKVGSIRSARFFDEHLVRMYSGLFVFGSADERTLDRLFKSGFSKRLILEWEAGCPALCRPDPVTNFLIADTIAVREYVQEQRISDRGQNLEGMRFQMQRPAGGSPVNQVVTWFSAVIYNRWSYDPVSTSYYRLSDVVNAIDGQAEEYEQLTDALTGEEITAENVVILLMQHDFFSVDPEVLEMQFNGSGPAYAFRDGRAYELEWVRPAKNEVVYLTTKEGEPFPFKPGVTWFEVMGDSSEILKTGRKWRFEMRFP
jgi:hypothetical protein